MINAKPTSVWDRRYPFLFSVALCAIAVIGDLVGYAILAVALRPSGATPTFSAIGTMVFLCNLPICFLATATVLRDTQCKVEALEARIKELESEKNNADAVEFA